MTPLLTRLRAWLAGRTEREQRLLAAAALVSVVLVVVGTVAAAHDDLEALRARVAGHERTLTEVRRLAAILRRSAPSADGAPAAPVATRLETTAREVVGRERVAGISPVTADGGPHAVALRVAGATLDEVVALLHACERQQPPLAVTRVALRKHPDDPAHLEATVEVADGDAP